MAELDLGRVVGPKGDPGTNGSPGVGIQSVTQTTTSSADGGSNVMTVTLSNGQKSTFTVVNGSKGSQGDPGPAGNDGKTPVAGVDYYTKADKAEFTAYLADELAKRGQLRPEFANSVEECTDTSLLYVLPDGYIYAYMRKKTPGGLINFVDKVGYTDNTRISTSSLGATKSEAGYVTTGIIDLSPYTSPMTIIAGGADFSYAYSAITSYNPDGTATASGTIANYIANPDSNFTDVAVDGSGNLTFNFRRSSSRTKIQICGYGKGADLSVTIDGVIGENTMTEGWVSTGHSFIPADYEDRIIDLEDDSTALKTNTESLSNRVASLEASADGSIPVYVLTEAEEVADKVLGVRNADSFVFGAVSDTHTTGSDASSEGVLHAGMGMDAINALTRLDMVANFGDVMANKFDSTYKAGFSYVRKCFAEVIKAVPYIQMQGNHDELPTDTTEQARQKYYAYIGANNNGVITDDGNRFRNYGYRDFHESKLRVIYLNTADVSDGDVNSSEHMSTVQLTWLNSVALNLNDPEWGILVFSHHPLNWLNISPLLEPLDAYKAKGTGAELIAHVHGHLHNFRVETMGSSGILSVTIPNACFGRNNEYGMSDTDQVRELYGDPDENGNQRVFSKVADSAQDTAFNVVVVDRQHRKIHCFNYGAGIDREIGY